MLYYSAQVQARAHDSMRATKALGYLRLGGLVNFPAAAAQTPAYASVTASLPVPVAVATASGPKRRLPGPWCHWQCRKMIVQLEMIEVQET